MKEMGFEKIFFACVNFLFAYSIGYKLIATRSLFDVSFYLEQNPGNTGSEKDLLRHYLVKGFCEKYDPHPLFSTSYYLKNNPDVDESGINPLLHYVIRGSRQGRNPHPIFDASYYLENNVGVIKPDTNPLVHYLLSGHKEGMSPHPLFDRHYYLDDNPDVAEAGVDPLLHYMKIGYKEKRDPHPLFNTFGYEHKYRDTIDSQENPLLHYISHGCNERADIHPLFNSSFYLEQNPGAVESGMNPLIHFLRYGYKKKSDLYLYKKREMSRKIETILIFEHVLPRFDMDSGSLRLFSIIKILVASGYRVILWAQPEAGQEKYVKTLEELNVELPFVENELGDYLHKNGDGIDSVILYSLTIAEQYLDAAMALMHAKIIFDTVDLTFLRNERRAKLEKKPVDNKLKQKELHYARCADEVLVVSPVEKEILVYEGLKDNVSVVTNIHSLETVTALFEDRTGLMFIGGFKHQPNVDGIIWFVQSIFPFIEQRFQKVHLYIVGSHPPDSVMSLASSNITVTGYVKDVGPYFEKARVFVSPLRYGAGVKGKIGQSMSFGLPVVTTTIGAEGMYLKDGESAMIADDADEFAQKVFRVYEDQELWQKLSNQACKIIERYFTPEVVQSSLLKVIKGDEEKE